MTNLRKIAEETLHELEAYSCAVNGYRTGWHYEQNLDNPKWREPHDIEQIRQALRFAIERCIKVADKHCKIANIGKAIRREFGI